MSQLNTVAPVLLIKMFSNTLSAPKLQRRRIASSRGGEALVRPNIAAHLLTHCILKAPGCKKHCGCKPYQHQYCLSSLHFAPIFHASIFPNLFWITGFLIFIKKGSRTARRVFKNNWPPIQNRLHNKYKRIESKTEVAKQDYSKWLFSCRKRKINTFLSLKYRFNNAELNNQRDAMCSRHHQGYLSTSDSSSTVWQRGVLPGAPQGCSPAGWWPNSTRRCWGCCRWGRALLK